MRIPLSWLKEYVDIDIPVELLAEKITLAGMEVEKLHYIGVPQTHVEGVQMPPSDHLVWDRDKLLLGAVREVKQHPDADRLVLAMVDYGGDEMEQCVTGAPNLFDYVGKGELDPPLWTAFAAEGAEVWDGHSDEPKRMILKGRDLRGIYNKSMVCSEKELGISDEHEGVILMFQQPTNHKGEPFAPGAPLQDVLGDVVIEVDLTPNLARAFSMVGIAREVAAILNKEVHYPSLEMVATGAPIAGEVGIDIREPELNPRFTFALLRDTEITESPEWMQRRLRLVGQRPINNVVDVTNYITFELGQPLHAFDYDKLVARAGGKPTIITRLPDEGETLETLDEIKRTLEPHNILVCDTEGVLSLGGVIGGAETEISDETTNVLLEAAAWNFINIRQTQQSQKVFTEAGTRFSRGVHPAQAMRGLTRGIELMRQTGGGEIADGVIDEYPAPPDTIEIELPISEVRRILGMDFAIETAADILRRLEFDVEYTIDTLRVTVPDHRLDISTGVIGQADLIEEIARIHGYDAIPTTIIADVMPEQLGNPELEREEKLRDLLVSLGLQENISYRFTTPEREAQLVPPNAPSSLPDADYVEMANPIAADKTVLRHTLMVNLLETAAANARYQSRQAVFEIGSVYLKGDDDLPDEPKRLGLLMTGKRTPIQDWSQNGDSDALMDFFDMKGAVEGLLDGLNITGYSLQRAEHTTFHPGRSAALLVGGEVVGNFGELHPRVAQAFDLTGASVFVAEFDLDALMAAQQTAKVTPLPVTPPVLQDIALVVDASTPAVEVETVIRQAGGDLLRDVRLFDVYTGDPIPDGKKSIAYSLTYQTDEKTLTDKEVAKVHKKIVKATKKRLGAELRG